MQRSAWGPAIIIALGLVTSGYFIGNMHRYGKEYSRSVQVKGLSEREVMADIAVWPINITLTGNNLAELRERIEDQKGEVYRFFVDQGFTEEELSSGPTNINDSRADFYNNQYREFRYIAKSEFTVRTTDISKLQQALSESLQLMSRGILIGSKNTWRPIEYSFTGLNELKPAMVEEATMNARQVAEKFAEDSNSKVGKIISANQGLFTISDRDENTPHIKIVRVVSTINYQLED